MSNYYVISTIEKMAVLNFIILGNSISMLPSHLPTSLIIRPKICSFK